MTLPLHPRTQSHLAAIGAGEGTQGYLLHGPAGMGKLAAALQVARRRACQAGGEDACAVCRQIESNAYPDLIRLDSGDKPSIGIEQVRELGQRLIVRPYAKTGARVILVSDAHRLTPAAQNGLLKLLEEPPERTLFLLVTDQPARLLATVRSRIGNVFFAPLQATEIAAWLVANKGAKSLDAAKAAESADGRPGLAIAALEVSQATAVIPGIVSGTVFSRLISAAQLASAKVDGMALSLQIHASVSRELRLGITNASAAGKIMQAAERLRSDLQGGVTLRTSLERFVLESA